MNESVVLPAREAIHSYVAHVRHHLSDLPPEELDELIGGLEADLAERASELPNGADLASAFGAPEAYAAELRSAAGLPPRVVTPAPAPPRGNVLRENELHWRSLREGFVAKHSWASELRPVWWVVRGAILAASLGLVFLGVGPFHPLVALLMLIGAALSFWWARRDPAPSSWANRLAILASAVALVAVIPMFFTLMARADFGGGTQYVYVDSPQSGGTNGSDGVWVNGEPATSLYAYDAEGNRLDRVRLFNQYGQAVAIPLQGLDELDQEARQQTDQSLPRKDNGEFDVNRVVFPLTWGTLTGWEASSGSWEPPVKISPLKPATSASPGAGQPSASPSPSLAPSPAASSSPSASPSASPPPSEPAADTSPAPTPAP